MCVQVDFANRDSQGRVRSIGGRGSGGWLGRPWHLSVEDAIPLVISERWLFVTVGEDGSRSVVEVASNTRAGQYLVSRADGSLSNNLDRLPPVNGSIPMGEAPSFPERPYVEKPAALGVRRGLVDVTPVRGGSYPVSATPVVGVRMRMPWPALPLVRVNGREVPDLGLVTSTPNAPGGGFYVEDISITAPAPGAPEENPIWLIRVVIPQFLRQSPVRITVRQRTISRVANPQPLDSKALAARLKNYNSLPTSVELRRSTPHPRLWDFPASERAVLATAIESYVTEDVVKAHHGLDHGTLVAPDHRFYLSDLEEHLVRQGLARFVPLPWLAGNEWVPDEFRKVLLGRRKLGSTNAGEGLPDTLKGSALCGIQDRKALWNAMRLWHGWVHERLGGAMSEIHDSPSALVFWPWHAYVDEIYRQWEACPPPS